MNIVEDPLFREIIKYASTSPKIIEEKNILHRTRASELTVQEYQKTMRIMREELKVCLLDELMCLCTDYFLLCTFRIRMRQVVSRSHVTCGQV